MTCKDCIHYDVCEPYVTPKESFPEKKGGCPCFKDKSRYIELPCAVGDIYYTIEKYCNTDPYATEKEKVSGSDCEYWCNGEHCSFKEYRIEEHKWASIITILEKEQWFGKYYFLTKEEAEQKLKEIKNDNRTN